MFGLTGSFPDILWDGYVNAEKADGEARLKPEYAICVDNGDAQVLNADLGNNSDNILVGDDQHQCEHEKLPAVVLAPPLG
jgi:hypothetical protein